MLMLRIGLGPGLGFKGQECSIYCARVPPTAHPSVTGAADPSMGSGTDHTEPSFAVSRAVLDILRAARYLTCVCVCVCERERERGCAGGCT